MNPVRLGRSCAYRFRGGQPGGGVAGQVGHRCADPVQIAGYPKPFLTGDLRRTGGEARGGRDPLPAHQGHRQVELRGLTIQPGCQLAAQLGQVPGRGRRVLLGDQAGPGRRCGTPRRGAGCWRPALRDAGAGWRWRALPRLDMMFLLPSAGDGRRARLLPGVKSGSRRSRGFGRGRLLPGAPGQRGPCAPGSPGAVRWWPWRGRGCWPGPGGGSGGASRWSAGPARGR